MNLASDTEQLIDVEKKKKSHLLEDSLFFFFHCKFYKICRVESLVDKKKILYEGGMSPLIHRRCSVTGGRA